MSDLVVLCAGCAVTLPFMLTGLWHAMHVDRKIKARGFLIMSAGYGVMAMTYALIDYREGACVLAGMGALFLYSWWNNGGGDGMRRSFKSWTARFSAKVAPQGA